MNGNQDQTAQDKNHKGGIESITQLTEEDMIQSLEGAWDIHSCPNSSHAAEENIYYLMENAIALGLCIEHIKDYMKTLLYESLAGKGSFEERIGRARGFGFDTLAREFEKKHENIGQKCTRQQSQTSY